MDPYVTEDQQVEALRQWWKENALSIVAGTVLGLVAVLGVRTWLEWNNRQAESASIEYTQVQNALTSRDNAQIQERARKLMDEFPGTPYGVLAAFAQGSALIEKGDLTGAQGPLTWAIERADKPYLKGLAQLRLARLALEQNNLPRAQELADQAALAGYTSQARELQGDIALAKGDQEGAKTAYRQALAGLPKGEQAGEMLRMKLDDLGGEL